MRKHLQYLKYVILHKWYVFIECCKLGIPVRGLLHDKSKFLLREWIPYTEHFYGDKNPRNDDGSYNPIEVGGTFDYAWLSHQHHNKHHWQYWILKGDSGYEKVLNIPVKYRKEMLADWRGAGKAINGKDDCKEWYLGNVDKMKLHPIVKEWLEERIL